jgi:hypothetical protein
MKTSSPTFRRRLIAGLLTAAFVVAQLVGFAHLAVERHEVCHEHGEVHHVDLTSAETDRDLSGPAVSPSEGEVSHEHCGLTLFHRQSARPELAADTPTTRVLAPERGLVRDSGGIERSVRLLLQAPKQSPPA